MNEVPELAKQESWDMIIKPKSGWFYIYLDELYLYRELVYMFVRRDFASFYTMTISALKCSIFLWGGSTPMRLLRRSWMLVRLRPMQK